MEFRKTTADDIELLMKLRTEMLRKVNGLPDDSKLSDELTENSRRYFLEGSQTTCIALDNGEAIACASISYIEVMPTYSHPTGKRAHIMNVYTRAGYRRKGIARKLVTMLIDEAVERGATEISLDSTEPGRPLYETLGFRRSDENMSINTGLAGKPAAQKG
jgi:ribosomal protein S18 acetylase RimI-like enzyme